MAHHQGDEEKPLPPGTMGWPIVGETLALLWKGINFYAEKTSQYGNIFKSHLLGSPTVRVSGADNVRSLVEKEPDQLEMKWPKSVVSLLGAQSLPASTGPDQPALKSHLEKGFTPIRLDNYFPFVLQNVQDNLQQWLERGEAGEQVIGFAACEDLTADIILEVVLGCRKEDDTDRKVRNALKDVNHNLVSLPVKIPFGGFCKALNARKIIAQFVETRMSTKADSDRDNASLMDLLLSIHDQGEGEGDDEKVKDNAIGIMMAGSASTSSALACLLYLLGKHPDVLEKVREELTSAGIAASDAELNHSTLQKLEYVPCVVKEALRVLPPVNHIYRTSVNQVDLNEYRIPKDWTVCHSIRDTHQLTSALLPNGDAFNPSRWLKQPEQQQGQGRTKGSTENPQQPPPLPPMDSASCNYIPFGSGPRMCLGRHLAHMILQVFIVEVARNANWTVVNPDCDMDYTPVTKPKDDLPLTFQKL